mgnify:CR=1 FL=1
MLRKRKGIATGTIMKLVLALMTASVFIGAGTVGSLGTALEEGFTNMGESTDYRIDLDAENEDEAKEKLSQAALFVRQRAGNQGCAEDAHKGSYKSVPKYVEEDGGYKALEDTYIGRYPTCESSTSTLSRGIKGSLKDMGSDQEGIYSRVAFKVIGDSSKDQDINLDTGDPTTWLEGGNIDNGNSGGIKAIKKGSLESSTLESCGVSSFKRAMQGATAGAVVGSVGTSVGTVGGATIGFVAGGLGNKIAGAKFIGTGADYIIFVRPDDMDDRVNKWIGNANHNGASYGYENRLYCSGLGQNLAQGDITDIFSGGLTRTPVNGAWKNYYNQNVVMKLCPGDEGYIQMNKGRPQNDAEAGEDWLSGASKYPYIEITEKGSCETEAVEPEGPVTGTVTNDATKEETGGNSDVIQDSGSGFQFEPSNSPNFNDFIVYQPLPEGDKTVTVRAEFSERGHLQIDAQKESGNFPNSGSSTVTYVNTDANKNEHLWINKPDGGYVDSGADYETDKTYTFKLKRNGNDISWTIKEEGTNIYTHTGQGNDFRRLVLESWESYGGSSATPSVKIKEVTVEEN